MGYQSSQKGDATVVTVEESRLDASIAGGFKDFMMDLIDSGNAEFVIDISEISFMDSSGLGVIVAILKQLNGKGSVKLVGPQKAVSDLFDLTCMDRIFKIYATVDEALNNSQ